MDPQVIIGGLYGLVELGSLALDLVERFQRGDIDEETLEKEWLEMQTRGTSASEGFKKALQDIRS